MAEDQEELATAPASSKTPTNWKKAFLALAVIAAFLVVGGGSFWLGLKKTSAPQIGESAVRTEIPSEEATAGSEMIPTIVLTPTVTPKPTEALTPTPTSTPTPTPTPTPTTKTFDSSALIDGFRSSNAGGNAGLEIRAGRNVNLVTRGFVSFGIGEIPDGTTIEQATLRLYQGKVIGNPYGAGLRVMVDHLDYGDTLEHADYGASSIAASFSILSTDADLEWKEVDVTDRVRDDLVNNRERSQYRLHFATESIGGTVTGDFAYFEAVENSMASGNTPQLVIRYH